MLYTQNEVYNYLGLYFLGLFLFQIKHWALDYPGQTSYMLQKGKPSLREAFLPLLVHSGLHAIGTFLIGILLEVRISVVIAMALMELILHFAMDRVKASPYMLGKYKILGATEFAGATKEQLKHNKYAWWALGIDQAFHHMTYIFIMFIWIITYIMDGIYFS